MVKRYGPTAKYIGSGESVGDMEVFEDGEYVTHDDYAKLEAERDKANEDASFAAKIYVKQLDIISELRAERDALRKVLVEVRHIASTAEGAYVDACVDIEQLTDTALAKVE